MEFIYLYLSFLLFNLFFFSVDACFPFRLVPFVFEPFHPYFYTYFKTAATFRSLFLALRLIIHVQYIYPSFPAFYSTSYWDLAVYCIFPIYSSAKNAHVLRTLSIYLIK